jgi:hypothetical protein
MLRSPSPTIAPAGAYIDDEEMLELGTAAVHLLTMATSSIQAHKE